MNSTKELDIAPSRGDFLVKNLGLAVDIVKSFYPYRPMQTDEFSDLVSIATLGLISAIDTFDESKGIQFATYATVCIKNSLNMYYRKSGKYAYNVPFSLDDVIFTDSNGNELTFDDCLASDKDIENDVIDDSNICHLLNIVLNLLPSKRKVGFLYYLANLPQREIASLLNVTQSYVSRLIKISIKQIKKMFNSVKISKKMYSFKILNADYYKFVIYCSNIENCIHSKDLAELFANLKSYRIQHDSGYYKFVLPRDEYSFFIIGRIIQVLELH